MTANFLGIALIIFGVILLITEAHLPTLGLVGAIGLLLFIFGLSLQLDPSDVHFQFDLILVISLSIIAALFLALLIIMAIRARSKPVANGDQILIGNSGIISQSPLGNWQIRVLGELWQATSDHLLTENEKVTIIGREGLILRVIPGEKTL